MADDLLFLPFRAVGVDAVPCLDRYTSESGGLHRRNGVILDRSSANFFGTRYRLGK